MNVNSIRARTGIILSVSALFLRPALSQTNAYVRHNLVSDLPGIADFTDPNLVNPWGISASATSPFWISNNGSGTTTLYNTNGQPFPAATPIVVQIPAPPGGMGGAISGQVFNSTSGFTLSGGKAALTMGDGDVARQLRSVEQCAAGREFRGRRNQRF